MHGRHGERASEGPAGLLAEYVGFSSCYVRAAVSWTGSLRPLRRADTTTAFVDFRLPELESLSELLALDVRIESEPDLELPYLIASFGSEAELRRYGSRSIMLKVAFVLWASAPTYAELHAALDGRTELVAPYRDERFAFYFSAHNATIAQDRKREIVDTFAYLSTGPDGLRGPIDLRNPQLEIGVFEYHAAGPARLHPDGVTLRRVFIGRKICIGQRALIDTFNLKKRRFIGNTSMSAEESLLMANQAQAAPGRLIYDPFAGTGSMLLTAAHFGALAFGSDIDGRMMRGKADESIWTAAEQYGVVARIADCLTFDLKQNPWRCGGMFDAVVTDPPYGVRAGAKRLGRHKPMRETTVDRSLYDRPFSVPLQPWELGDVLETLLEVSHFLLRTGGRLVYFIPVELPFKPSNLPTHPGFRLVANSPQNFGKWERRLITMEKLAPSESSAAAPPSSSTVPNFRESYFRGFVPAAPSPSS